jgi:hypothetical protein
MFFEVLIREWTNDETMCSVPSLVNKGTAIPWKMTTHITISFNKFQPKQKKNQHVQLFQDQIWIIKLAYIYVPKSRI